MKNNNKNKEREERKFTISFEKQNERIPQTTTSLNTKKCKESERRRTLNEVAV